VKFGETHRPTVFDLFLNCVTLKTIYCSEMHTSFARYIESSYSSSIGFRSVMYQHYIKGYHYYYHFYYSLLSWNF